MLGAMVVLRTFAYAAVDDYLVFVHSDIDPSDEDWTQMIAETAPMVRTLKGTLVLAGDIKQSARQRKELAEALAGTPVKAAVLSGSALLRGAVTALGWLGGKHRAFAMHELDKALDYLNVPPDSRRRIRDLISELRLRLDVSRRKTAEAAAGVRGRDNRRG
jgi:hypothetical protein